MGRQRSRACSGNGESTNLSHIVLSSIITVKCEPPALRLTSSTREGLPIPEPPVAKPVFWRTEKWQRRTPHDHPAPPWPRKTYGFSTMSRPLGAIVRPYAGFIISIRTSLSKHIQEDQNGPNRYRVASDRAKRAAGRRFSGQYRSSGERFELSAEFSHRAQQQEPRNMGRGIIVTDTGANVRDWAFQPRRI
jgi:hypothetical protein